uniref:HET domain-containing protein n=1 Tax=Heligmosomoides polygyrus TaxID=6339 RepID=A0A8L8KI25_HELPZ
LLEILLVVPRIQGSKADQERYQRTIHSTSLAENLKDKVVVDRPAFLIVFKDDRDVDGKVEAGLSIRNARRNFANFKAKMTALRRSDGTVTFSRRTMEKVIHDSYSDLFDSHLISPEEEKALIDFVLVEKLLTPPAPSKLQFLNLFDLIHDRLSTELSCLRRVQLAKSGTTEGVKGGQNASEEDDYRNSLPPFERALPLNVNYGPRTVLPIRELTFKELRDVEDLYPFGWPGENNLLQDMPSMAIYRKLDIVVGQVHSQRAVEFLSRVAQLWGYRLDENVSLQGGSTRLVVHFERLPRLILMGQCESSSLDSATVGAYSAVVAALCYMQVVPFEMWTMVMKTETQDWIEAVIYACRYRFAQLVILSYTPEFMRLMGFIDDFDGVISEELLALWHRFIHMMRQTGIEYWKICRDVRIPVDVRLQDLSTYKGKYFRFSSIEGSADFTVMNPGTKFTTTNTAACEPTPAARYGEQEYELGLLPKIVKSQNAPICPITGAENWHDASISLPDDPLVQITARDCETRGDSLGSRWQSPVNELLIEEICLRFKWKLLSTHRIQLETNGQFTHFFHMVNLKFEDIPPFFLQGLGKHVNFRETVTAIIRSSLPRYRSLPVSNFRKCLVKDNVASFFELYTLASAELSMPRPGGVMPELFPRAFEFARCVRDSSMRFWCKRQVVLVPKSIHLPKINDNTCRFFLFVKAEGFERWDEFAASTTEYEHYDKKELFSANGKLPPWDKGASGKQRPTATLSINDACKKLQDCEFTDHEVDTLRTFVESLAASFFSSLSLREFEEGSQQHCELKFRGEAGDFLVGRGASDCRRKAYSLAMRELYSSLLNCAFVLPSLHLFMGRTYRKNSVEENMPLSRIPFIVRTIRPLMQRFVLVVRRYRNLVAGCDRATKKTHSEQLLSLVRRLNLSTWKSHPVLLPFHLFIDFEDAEPCRSVLQPFLEVLEPNTIWVGDVEDRSKAKRENPYSQGQYALTMDELKAEVTTMKPRVVATEKAVSAKKEKKKREVPRTPDHAPEEAVPVDEPPQSFDLPWQDEMDEPPPDSEMSETIEVEADEYLD